MRKRAIPNAARRALALRAGIQPGTKGRIYCHYCRAEGVAWWPLRHDGRPGAWVAFADMEIDHIYPESLGGQATIDNLVFACGTCNRSKGATVRA